MARWETYQLGNAVRLRRAGGTPAAAPAVVVPAPAVAATAVFDESLSKPELIAEAEARGLDATGTKAEILERLNG